MTLSSLQALTWGTVTGAIVSAILLAANEPGWPELSRLRRSDASRPPTATPASGKQRSARPDAQAPAAPIAPPAR
jgi:hypothetical protein